MLVGSVKEDNIARAVRFIGECKAKGADVVVLPECFNSPYGTKHFAKYAEHLQGGMTATQLSQAAAMHKLWVVAGSIPEIGDPPGRYYNTNMTFDPSGRLAATFR